MFLKSSIMKNSGKIGDNEEGTHTIIAFDE